MNKYTDKQHPYTSRKYKDHFDDDDFVINDLRKIRSNQENKQQEIERLAHFEDMKDSSNSYDKNDITYQIYKPIYNIAGGKLEYAIMSFGNRFNENTIPYPGGWVK